MNQSTRERAQPSPLIHHATQTLRLGLPLVAAQLAQMAMGVTDTIYLGRLGPEALAAGGLGNSLHLTVLITLQGVAGAVSVFIAQARGAGRPADVPGLFWSAAAIALALSVPAFALLSVAEPLLLAAGEPPPLAHDASRFLDTVRWGVPGEMLGFGLMRAVLPAIGAGWLILPITLAATVCNAIVGYALAFGHGGLPAIGLRGPAVATALVGTLAATALLAVAFTPSRRRWVRWARPRLGPARAIVRVGLPIGATLAVEAGLFVAVALLIGRLGPVELAAQQVSISVISVAFMAPLGLAQAANIRVGHRVGAADREGARAAGLIAIGLGAVAECLCALANWWAPERLARLYLEPGTAADTVGAVALTVSLLRIAAVFQVADGVQCVAAGALRGIGDTRVPFLLAALGYWGIGFPAAWGLTVVAGMGAVGAWWGLAAGLSVTATLLTMRFARRTARGRVVDRVAASG